MKRCFISAQGENYLKKENSYELPEKTDQKSYPIVLFGRNNLRD